MKDWLDLSVNRTSIRNEFEKLGDPGDFSESTRTVLEKAVFKAISKEVDLIDASGKTVGKSMKYAKPSDCSVPTLSVENLGKAMSAYPTYEDVYAVWASFYLFGFLRISFPEKLKIASPWLSLWRMDHKSVIERNYAGMYRDDRYTSAGKLSKSVEDAVEELAKAGKTPLRPEAFWFNFLQWDMSIYRRKVDRNEPFSDDDWAKLVVSEYLSWYVEASGGKP